MIIHLGIGQMSLQAIAKAINGKMSACLPCSFVPKRLVTSSHEVQEDDIFLALQGNRDGHDYISDALRKGATAVIVEKPQEKTVPYIQTKDTKTALGLWAKAALQSSSALRIAITGSVGKTTTKNKLAAFLRIKYRTHATEGNLNNHLGVPFTLLSAPKDTEIIVAECGINHPDEMNDLSEILSPHLSLITCIGHAHIGAFQSRAEIAKEKLRILEHAKEAGMMFVPIYEPLLAILPPKGIRRIAVSPFTEREIKHYSLPISVSDIPSCHALAFSAAVGYNLGMTEKEVKDGLHLACQTENRMCQIKAKDLLLLNDGYNASPEAMMAAFYYLTDVAPKRRVAVIGDMLELGAQAAPLHRAMGKFAAAHADLLIFYGNHREDYALGAIGGGAVSVVSRRQASCRFDTTEMQGEQLAYHLLPFLQAGDTVLFKASRALKASETAEAVASLIKQSK